MEFIDNLVNLINQHLSELKIREDYLIALLSTSYFEEEAEESYKRELERINNERKRLFGLLDYIDRS